MRSDEFSDLEGLGKRENNQSGGGARRTSSTDALALQETMAAAAINSVRHEARVVSAKQCTQARRHATQRCSTEDVKHRFVRVRGKTRKHCSQWGPDVVCNRFHPFLYSPRERTVKS